MYFNLLILAVSLLLRVSSAEDVYHQQFSTRRDGHGNTPQMQLKSYATDAAELQTTYWLQQAQDVLQKRLQFKQQRGSAKNVIIFLGDGLSIATLTAARILKGQRMGHAGESAKLAIEDFPYTGFSKTYSVDRQTSDSASTATAYLTGVKTNSGTIGLNARAKNCADSANTNYHTESIMTWAQRAGKSTGIVTTTRVTHASPAGAYAHVANREWECDADMDSRKGACLDIAKQLITTEPGRNFDVILGGGLTKFLPVTKVDAFGRRGERKDGLNLIEQWQLNNPHGKFISTLKELQSLNTSGVVERVFGTFASSHMAYHLNTMKSKKRNLKTQPRLKDLTAAALKLLGQKSKHGYVVFIEGGRIDHGHHETRAGYALDETLEFDEAIKSALELTKPNETLIVVTADHAHTLSMAGYAKRGTAILGLDESNRDKNNVPYSTLNYALGKEQYVDGQGRRFNPHSNLSDTSYTPSYIPAVQGVHSGEDVGIFALGPNADLFSGVIEQNVIPHLIAYAACIGNGLTFCNAK